MDYENIQIFLKQLLHKCDIQFNNFNDLNGMVIPRDILLYSETITTLQPEIERLRKIYSSSNMTCLHKNSIKKQQFPLLNLVRQVMKTLNYKMEPIRMSNGYDKTGKKLYTRYFKFVKLN
jgi:hypothetical protein